MAQPFASGYRWLAPTRLASPHGNDGDVFQRLITMFAILAGLLLRSGHSSIRSIRLAQRMQFSAGGLQAEKTLEQHAVGDITVVDGASRDNTVK